MVLRRAYDPLELIGSKAALSVSQNRAKIEKVGCWLLEMYSPVKHKSRREFVSTFRVRPDAGVGPTAQWVRRAEAGLGFRFWSAPNAARRPARLTTAGGLGVVSEVRA
jgi:hypothetical protein